MLDLKFIRQNPETVKQALTDRDGYVVDIEGILKLDASRREKLADVEALKHEKNRASKAIGILKREGKEASGELERMKEVSGKIKELDREIEGIQERLSRLLDEIPNIPDKSVPVGKGDEGNVRVREAGERPSFDFEPAPHWEIGENLGILDLARGARVASSHFPLFRGLGARLERALSSFMLNIHTGEHGYTEVSPPCLVNADSMRGTGQLPLLAQDMYRVEEDGLYPIPTAEVPLVSMHRGEVLKEEALPIAYVAATPCFRREAGSYGKETRGIQRVHQFEKVELVRICRPESSLNMLERMLSEAEKVLNRLELPYRVVELCTGELSFASTKTYDLEVWSAGLGRWLEVSSCSSCGDFQARRSEIRMRRRDGSLTHPHTLNASGVALPRTIIALLENGQTENGTVRLPQALVPYMGGISEIR